MLVCSLAHICFTWLPLTVSPDIVTSSCQLKNCPIWNHILSRMLLFPKAHQYKTWQPMSSFWPHGTSTVELLASLQSGQIKIRLCSRMMTSRITILRLMKWPWLVLLPLCTFIHLKRVVNTTHLVTILLAHLQCMLCSMLWIEPIKSKRI